MITYKTKKIDEKFVIIITDKEEKHKIIELFIYMNINLLFFFFFFLLKSYFFLIVRKGERK